MDANTPLESTVRKTDQGAYVDLILIGAILVILLVTAILGLSLVFRPRSTEIAQLNSILQPTDAPIQTSVKGETADPIVWEDNGMIWTIQPRASYQIAARVLGNRRYYDWQSSVVPRDLALGWGEMSDPAVDEWIRWRQSGRWYRYEWGSDMPYDPNYVADHSANIHIIPSTDNLDKALREI